MISVVGLILVPQPYNGLMVIPSIIIFMTKYFMPWIRRRFVIAELDETLVYLITHMHALSTGKPPRYRLFTLQGVAEDYGEYNRYLRKIAVMAKEWGYGFGRACQLVAKEVKNSIMRDFLLRLSEVLN